MLKLQHRSRTVKLCCLGKLFWRFHIEAMQTAELSPPPPPGVRQHDSCVAGAGLTSKFTEVMRAAEQKAMEVLTYQLREVVKKSPPQDWAPEAPVQSAGNRAQYVLSLIEYIKVRGENPKMPAYTCRLSRWVVHPSLRAPPSPSTYTPP